MNRRNFIKNGAILLTFPFISKAEELVIKEIKEEFSDYTISILEIDGDTYQEWIFAKEDRLPKFLRIKLKKEGSAQEAFLDGKKLKSFSLGIKVNRTVSKDIIFGDFTLKIPVTVITLSYTYEQGE